MCIYISSSSRNGGLNEGSAGGSVPSGVAGAEIGPVGGGAIGEVVQPKGQHHFLLILC